MRQDGNSARAHSPGKRQARGASGTLSAFWVLTRMRASERKRLLKPGASGALVARFPSGSTCIEFMSAELVGHLEAERRSPTLSVPVKDEI